MKNLFFTCIAIAVLLTCTIHGVNAQGISISPDNSTPDPSAMLDVSGASKGVLINRMTTEERDAIASPAQALLIYNLTNKCFETYEIGLWQAIWCSCGPPATPLEGSHVPSATQIVWNWNAVSGATGYKYNTLDEYGTATDNGPSTSFTQTGLTCNTPYTIYVWAYNACGVSPSVEMDQTSFVCFTCGISSIDFTYRGSGVTYGTAVGQNGTCWLDRNLGASQAATSVTDSQAYGDWFQWGRGDDGHQVRNPLSGTTTSVSATDQPGHANFIYDSPDWRSPKNDNLWQGVNGINNPCPAGWRIPTITELDNERLSWSPANSAGAYASALKWTMGGLRSQSNSLNSVGGYGIYWSSTVTGNNVFDVYLSGTVEKLSHDRVNGMSVRCIKD